MPELSEAIPGTSFLVVPVLIVVFYGLIPWTTVIALIAALAIPFGWLAFNFEGFYLTWKGRYEDSPPYKHIRDKIEVKSESSKIVVDLDKVLPRDIRVRRIECSNQTEYQILFDPFRRLTRLWLFEMILGPSFRKTQPELYKSTYGNEIKPFYVENVEDMTFFDKPALANYIREQTKYWHIMRATFYGFFWGIANAIGLFLVIMSNFFLVNLLIFALFIAMIGLLICGGSIALLCWIAYECSGLRRSESLAHEHLLIRLAVA